MKSTRADAGMFLLGFAAVAIPGTCYLLSLPYGDNDSTVATVIVAQFVSGFAFQYAYRQIKARRAARTGSK